MIAVTAQLHIRADVTATEATNHRLSALIRLLDTFRSGDGYVNCDAFAILAAMVADQADDLQKHMLPILDPAKDLLGEQTP
jgi:hypothetical protein